MKVEPKTCISCGACVNSCPVGAISFKEGKAFINKEVCIRCGFCKQICPVSAIKDE